VLTTPIAAPVVLISGEPDMPLTVSFGLGPKRGALMATTSSQARSSESRCAGNATSTEGKAAGWSLIARKAHAGRGGGATSNGGSASTKASYCPHSSPSDWLPGAPSTVMSATGSAK